MTGRAIVLRGDAADLPLPDESVDLVCTSPPYFGLRSYTDDGEHYDGQIGSEETPQAYVAALLECTREWMRILKPEGSIFVNLGDKYAGGGGGAPGGVLSHRATAVTGKDGDGRWPGRQKAQRGTVREKSLIGLPWRYALGCVDDLGLILRAEIVWAKPNGLPESVQDRVRRSHEQVFHFTRSARYFAAVDEIRQPHQPQSMARSRRRYDAGDLFSVGTPNTLDPAKFCNPLGALPGSVWEIPSQPLAVPAHLGVDHFAAFPMELPRRIILGWSPSGICTECGEGRRPVAAEVGWVRGKSDPVRNTPSRFRSPLGAQNGNKEGKLRALTGYACACTPYTDHPGTGEPSGPYGRHADAVAAGTYENVGAGWGGKGGLSDRPRVGPWREYHIEGWAAPSTRPAVVVDPFGGTGTAALVADVLGRTGITVDRSADYCRLARWRTSDPGERARALGAPKPPPVSDGQGSLFDGLEAS